MQEKSSQVMNISGYLTGHLLVAMPDVSENLFDKAVVFVCRHDENGAMGFVVNQPLEGLDLLDLLQQIENAPLRPPDVGFKNPPIYWGGPVEMNRGFVIHSLDYRDDATLEVTPSCGITANLEVLHDLFRSKGPQAYVLALGYTGWEPDQLEKELADHAWLVLPFDHEILFDVPAEQRWDQALARLGIHDALCLTKQGRA